MGRKAHKTPALTLCRWTSRPTFPVSWTEKVCVSFQPSRRHRLGWEVRPSFSVSQNADRAELLSVIRERWGCGFIRPDRSDKTLKFEVRNVRDVVERVLPHFRAHPLASSKQADVERFERVCSLIYDDQHQSSSGFGEIVRIAMKMNPSGKRKYSGSEILNSLRSGERIVCATGNRGRRGQGPSGPRTPGTKFRPARMA